MQSQNANLRKASSRDLRRCRLVPRDRRIADIRYSGTESEFLIFATVQAVAHSSCGQNLSRTQLNPSPDDIGQVLRVISQNVNEHHKKFSYQEEIREIFKRHRVAFDELCLGLKHQWVGRPREAVLGLPSRNCTPRRGVGSAFRAGRL